MSEFPTLAQIHAENPYSEFTLGHRPHQCDQRKFYIITSTLTLLGHEPAEGENKEMAAAVHGITGHPVLVHSQEQKKRSAKGLL